MRCSHIQGSSAGAAATAGRCRGRALRCRASATAADPAAPSKRRAVVVGGGWAGLGAAYALQQVGEAFCLVLPSLGPGSLRGAGLQYGLNGSADGALTGRPAWQRPPARLDPATAQLLASAATAPPLSWWLPLPACLPVLGAATVSLWHERGPAPPWLHATASPGLQHGNCHLCVRVCCVCSPGQAGADVVLLDAAESVGGLAGSFRSRQGRATEPGIKGCGWPQRPLTPQRPTAPQRPKLGGVLRALSFEAAREAQREGDAVRSHHSAALGACRVATRGRPHCQARRPLGLTLPCPAPPQLLVPVREPQRPGGLAGRHRALHALHALLLLLASGAAGATAPAAPRAAAALTASREAHDSAWKGCSACRPQPPPPAPAPPRPQVASPIFSKQPRLPTPLGSFVYTQVALRRGRGGGEGGGGAAAAAAMPSSPYPAPTPPPPSPAALLHRPVASRPTDRAAAAGPAAGVRGGPGGVHLVRPHISAGAVPVGLGGGWVGGVGFGWSGRKGRHTILGLPPLPMRRPRTPRTAPVAPSHTRSAACATPTRPARVRTAPPPLQPAPPPPLPPPHPIPQLRGRVSRAAGAVPGAHSDGHPLCAAAPPVRRGRAGRAVRGGWGARGSQARPPGPRCPSSPAPGPAPPRLPHIPRLPSPPTLPCRLPTPTGPPSAPTQVLLRPGAPGEVNGGRGRAHAAHARPRQPLPSLPPALTHYTPPYLPPLPTPYPLPPPPARL
jgi:hypothetical protein